MNRRRIKRLFHLDRFGKRLEESLDEEVRFHVETRAEQLVRAKLRRESLGDDGAKVSRRLVAMLARRGYTQTMAYDVVSTELAAERERRRV